MALAIKRIHNFPPHLSYVNTLHDITQHKNRNPTLTSSLTLGIVFLRASASSTNLLQTRLHAWVNTKGRHFEHIL